MTDTIQHPFWPAALKAWGVLTALAWLFGPFLAAGTARWPAIWFYMATIAVSALVQRIYIARANPEVLVRRKQVTLGTKRWDVAWVFATAPLMVLPPIAAGWAVRAGMAPLPAWCALLGLLGNTAGGFLWTWAMACNPFFEVTVRVQHERGHTVVDRGPYRFVRHPGYASFVVGGLGAPLMLLSWPALAAGPLLVACFVLRAALEDRTLRRELPGYTEYARRVRYRLLPGIW